MTNQLDMTDSKNRGQALVDEIIKTVGDSQAFILTPLPDELLVTDEQYVSLLPYEEHMQAMSDYSIFTDAISRSDNKLFYTPHNVMEVRVAGVPNFKDASNA